MTKKIAVLLSGCGHRDGSEIHETTLTLLAIDRLGATYTGFAPNYDQATVVNHLDGGHMGGNRNILIESARIMRGNVRPVQEASAHDFDALILPGGFGAALSLCNYGKVGRNCEIDTDVENLIIDFVKAGKPVGAICIAPVVVARALKSMGRKATLTIGSDLKVAEDIEGMGMIHKNCAVNDIVVDTANKIVTTPAYMLAKRIGDVDDGISKLVKEIFKIA